MRSLGAQKPFSHRNNYTAMAVVVTEQTPKHKIAGEILSALLDESGFLRACRRKGTAQTSQKLWSDYE